jgi:hypothetical protein
MIIPATWILPDAIRARLGQTTYGRQRAIIEDGHLVLVLHKPPGPDDRLREGVLFWRSPDGEWQCNRGGPGSGGLKRHVQSFAELETSFTSQYEKAADIDTLFILMDALTPLSRSARNMHGALQMAREAFKAEPFIIEMRDMASDIERNYELLLDDVRTEIQHRSARDAQAQAQNAQAALQASHRLNILAALFFPLTAVTSLFGMNFAHGFNKDSPGMFWLVFIISTALGFAMKGWVLGNSGNGEAKKK